MNPTAMELPLRDIHLPDPISWWPLAVGWWLIFGVLLTAFFLFAFILKKYFTPTLKGEALRALANIEKSFQQSGDAKQCLSALSAFLRRVSLTHDASISPGVTGQAWLQVLDAPLDTPEFSQGIGRVLLSAPYCAHVDNKEATDLLQLCRKWVNCL